MVDRIIVYTAALPEDTDVLLPQQLGMIAQGYALQAAYGQNTVVVGLTCTPTSPASMKISVGPGAIMTPSILESTPFGSLPADTVTPLVKMGINAAPTLFTLTVPSTAGQSQNYLIQVSFSESDDTPETLTYYNSLNPAQSFSGPNNSGTPQNTRREQRANLQLKVGTPANTGTQITPPVDQGWIGLYVITVSNGQTSVVNGSITTYPGAPFLAPFLSSHHGGVPGQAPKINLASEVTGILPLANVQTLPPLRTTLQANLNLFVSTTGNNTNTGLSSGSPLLTLQAAVNLIYNKYDMNGFSATINLANGTYTQGATFSGTPIGSGPSTVIAIVGNTTTPGNVAITYTSGPCILANVGALVSVTGVVLSSTGTAPAGTFGTGIAVAAINAAIVLIGNVAFSTCSVAQIYAANSGTVENVTPNTYAVVGSSPSHLNADVGGFINLGGVTISFVNSPVFSTGFAVCSRCSTIQVIGLTFSGTVGAVSPRYASSMNAVVYTNGGGANFLPGTAAGSTGFGGQYV